MTPDRKDDLIIDELKEALKIHINSQTKYEERQFEFNKSIQEFIERADPVITAFRNITNASDIFSKIIMGTAKIFLALGAILGVIYTIKEWIRKG